MKTTTLNIILAATLATSPLAYAADDGHDHGKQPTAAATDGHAEEGGGGHADEVKLTAAAVKQNKVRSTPVATRSLQASFVAPARVAFNTEAMAHVGSVVSGRVTDIKVRQGDRVKKGDVLIEVESPELGRAQSEYLQKQTEAEVAAAAVGPAKDAYDRAKKLFDESQGIALSEVQKREVEYRAAVGTKATSQAGFEASENGLHLLGFSQDDVTKLRDTKEINAHFVIRAPIDGQVVQREVTLGELVSPDKEQLLVIADTTNYWVLADVPEARLSQIDVGSRAELQLSSLVGERIAGEVSLVSAEIDPTTRAARVRIVVENTGNKLKPGMFARAMLFASDAADSVLALPEEAVQTVEGEPSVFVPVEGEENTFARREVSVGKAMNGYVPVLSGLKEGESVVTSGSFILKAELGKGSAEHAH